MLSRTLAARVSLSPDSPTQMFRQSLRMCRSRMGFFAGSRLILGSFLAAACKTSNGHRHFRFITTQKITFRSVRISGGFPLFLPSNKCLVALAVQEYIAHVSTYRHYGYLSKIKVQLLIKENKKKRGAEIWCIPRRKRKEKREPVLPDGRRAVWPNTTYCGTNAFLSGFSQIQMVIQIFCGE